MTREHFNNGKEFFTQRTDSEGNRDLIFGTPDATTKGHARIDRFGNVQFLRESDGRKITNDFRS